MADHSKPDGNSPAQTLDKSIVLVGLMGSGKSSVGKRLAEAHGLPFVDVDDEVILAANLTIAEIFEQYGEAEFRALEHRVLDRLLSEGPYVVATGGGAFMSEANREIIAKAGLSVWLDADLEVLWERVRHKKHRPLLNNENPKAVLSELLEVRNPIYQLADFRVPSYLDQTHEDMVMRISEVIGLPLPREEFKSDQENS